MIYVSQIIDISVIENVKILSKDNFNFEQIYKMSIDCTLKANIESDSDLIMPIFFFSNLESQKKKFFVIMKNLTFLANFGIIFKQKIQIN